MCNDFQRLRTGKEQVFTGRDQETRGDKRFFSGREPGKTSTKNEIVCASVFGSLRSRKIWDSNNNIEEFYYI
ncbi:MAG: hypothetical protein JEZ03_09395 [Bacteroidales bacterium]|nr:hypothetical protein [Bacteroidales bacterium]